MSERVEERRARHPDVYYEPRDLSHRAVFLFLMSLGLGIFVTMVLIFGVFKYWGKTQFSPHPTTNPMMTSNEQLKELGGDPALVFPKPQLQPNPIADLNKFRAAEEEELNSYGWIDPGAGKIHIPIERAVEIVGSSWPNQQSARALQAAEAQPASGRGMVFGAVQTAGPSAGIGRKESR